MFQYENGTQKYRLRGEPKSTKKWDGVVIVSPYDMMDAGGTLMDAMPATIKNSLSKDCPLCIHHVASVFGPTPDPLKTAKDNVNSTEFFKGYSIKSMSATHMLSPGWSLLHVLLFRGCKE